MILVQHVLEDARRRLALLSQDAPVCDAAAILANESTPLVVVCDGEGTAVGVLTRSDIIRAFSRAPEDAHRLTARAIMSTPVVSCLPDQTLESVWATMGTRCLRCTPVLDRSRKPQGVLHARDMVRALLGEITNEEVLLRDYVMGIGYQ